MLLLILAAVAVHMPLSGCLLIIALCILVRRLVLASVAPRTRHLDTQTDSTQHNTQHSLTHTQAQLTRGTLTHTHLNGIEFTFNLIVCFLTFLLVSGSGFISCFLLLFVYLLPLFLRFAFCVLQCVPIRCGFLEGVLVFIYYFLCLWNSPNRTNLFD